MSTLEEIIMRSWADQTFTVEVDSAYGTVCITDHTGVQEDIFLQGSAAYDFIHEAYELYDRVGTVSLDHVYHHLAYQYAENLWN